jgi:hypothetical protein
MARILRFTPPVEAVPVPEGQSSLAVDFATGKPWEPPPPVYVPRKRKRGSRDGEWRKAMLAKIHIAKAQLGLKEEEYRDMLWHNFGVDSSADLDMERLDEFLGLLANVGFRAKKRRDAPEKLRRAAGKGRGAQSATRANGSDDAWGTRPPLRKIEALLAEKGRVEGTDVPWGYAVAILRRQTGGLAKCLDKAEPGELRGVVAALTRDAKRKGRVT